MLSVSTNFQVTGYQTSWKIQCFHFFPLKSLCNQNWACCKIGQGQPKVMIYINYDGKESPQCYIPSFVEIDPPVPEKKIFYGFYHIWAWRPSWSCDHDYLYKLSFPLPTDAPREVWLWLVKHFQRRRSLKLWTTTTTDGRTPEHGHPISSPFEPSAQAS